MSSASSADAGRDPATRHPAAGDVRAATEATRVTAPLVPAKGVLLGAYVDLTGRWIDDATAEAGVAHLETEIGRTLGIDHHYYAWTDRFPTSLERWDVASGRIPMISWGGTQLDAILSGSDDAMIRQRARDVRNLGAPVFLRWGWEMNGDWSVQDGSHNNSPGTTDGPRKYVAAWRRIVDLFRSQGATNAVWVWSPNASDVPAAAWNHWTRYYPGDAYVDWVGIDAYNWGTTRSFSSWTPLADLIGPLYSDYAGRKPIMVAETASAEQGGDKAGWIDAVRTSLEKEFPAVAALVYFDTNKETDWSVRSSPSALRAFRSLAADPYFGPRATSPTRAQRELTGAVTPGLPSSR